MMRVMAKKDPQTEIFLFYPTMGKDQDEVDTALELIKAKKAQRDYFPGWGFQEEQRADCKDKGSVCCKYGSI